MFSKSKWCPEIFYYNNHELDCVTDIEYLGFTISYNVNMKLISQDRQNKAIKMSNVVLRALRTSHNVSNVSTKLKMSLFDKYVSPILLYGSVVWGAPCSFNMIYLLNQPENLVTRSAVTRALEATCGYPVDFHSARRVGKAKTSTPRPILINLKSI